ncbi:hypothetical protein [Okeania hirsuta]|uniref:hypothetical protein n=1 Tax=Okeania hirsuta TaxID=1458930 RepID=UPI00144B207E|nr:hypothetical protein [Okeania hirsuta]NET76951.1 hypothetical protein [Okeania sp. SIO1F9]
MINQAEKNHTLALVKHLYDIHLKFFRSQPTPAPPRRGRQSDFLRREERIRNPE